jgi:hypothetical protein
MDGSPQCGLLCTTTLWHFDAAERAPSTASKADIRVQKGMSVFTPKTTAKADFRTGHVCFTPESGLGPRPNSGR